MRIILMNLLTRKARKAVAIAAVCAAFAAVTPPLVINAYAANSPVDAAELVGKKAPDFSITDTNGKARKLSDFKGKYIVLEWFNFECPFVKKHYDSNNMQKLQKEYTGKGVVWLSICSSGKGKPGNGTAAEQNAEFKKKGAAPTAILLDEDGTIGKLYGAKTTPDMYVIDKKGELVYAGAIDSKATADSSDIPSSTNYVKEALDEALSSKPVATASTKSYGCSVKYGG
jgi:peroxiredoxin